jgi:hypothetical protein
MVSGHQSAFDKIFKMADTRRESSKMSITTCVGFFRQYKQAMLIQKDIS